MRYGIVLNMEYDQNPYELVNQLFEEIREQLIKHGFRQDGRMFSIELPAEQAGHLARQAVEEVAEREEHRDSEVYGYIREYYGFEIANVVNLLLPGSGEIAVAELDELPVEALKLPDSQ